MRHLWNERKVHVNVICGVLRLVVVAVPTDDRPHPMTAQGLSKVQAASKTVTPGEIATVSDWGPVYSR